MTALNRGKAFHGSRFVAEGGLRGTTDTDYHYFLCPSCPDKHIMRILDYKVVADGPANYAKNLNQAPHRDFIIAFELYCQACKHHDFVKVSDIGWQRGSTLDSRRFGEENPSTAP